MLLAADSDVLERILNHSDLWDKTFPAVGTMRLFGCFSTLRTAATRGRGTIWAPRARWTRRTRGSGSRWRTVAETPSVCTMSDPLESLGCRPRWTGTGHSTFLYQRLSSWFESSRVEVDVYNVPLSNSHSSRVKMLSIFFSRYLGMTSN